MSEWADLRWFLRFNGIADAWLWGFDADGWRLRHGEPANGTLGILPIHEGQVATVAVARWLADALSYDHDAPIGILPAMMRAAPESEPADSDARPPIQPINPYGPAWTRWYWEDLNASYGAAAELRFNGSYVVRYDSDKPVDTNFSKRFKGREELVSMYAMAARQPDILAEYMCLYRVLEAADRGSNGTGFATRELPALATRDYGDLRVVADELDSGAEVNAFDVYRNRALSELATLTAEGVDDVAAYLYRIRTSLAHGSSCVLTGSHAEPFARAGRALPIVKLLARAAIDP